MKKIPFGYQRPNEEETTLLTSLGFKLEKNLKIGDLCGKDCYLLEIEDKRMQLKERIIDPCFSEMILSLNNIDVIYIEVKKLSFFNCVINFNFNKKNIKKALKQPDIFFFEKEIIKPCRNYDQEEIDPYEHVTRGYYHPECSIM